LLQFVKSHKIAKVKRCIERSLMKRSTASLNSGGRGSCRARWLRIPLAIIAQPEHRLPQAGTFFSGRFNKEANNRATEVRKIIGTTTRNKVPIRYYGSIFEAATGINKVILDSR
jgi:hypothetical protein